MIANYISTFFIFAGVFFFAVGVAGLLRFPDIYSRLHATTKCDTLGAGLVLVGLAIQGTADIVLKLVIIVFLLWITNPTAAHVIARASLLSGIPQVKGSFEMNFTQGRKDEHQG